MVGDKLGVIHDSAGRGAGRYSPPPGRGRNLTRAHAGPILIWLTCAAWVHVGENRSNRLSGWCAFTTKPLLRRLGGFYNFA